MSERDRVRRRFAAAADSYDTAAVVQRQIGERLLAGLSDGATPARMLDLGCGTGHGLGLLARRWPDAALTAVDFALPMLQRLAPPAPPRLCADAEALPLADACVDLVWSNLTLQWCDPLRFARETARVLRPEGRLAVSTLGPATFAELRRAFVGVDHYRHTIEFSEPAAIVAAFAATGLHDLRLERLTVTSRHPDLKTLLAEVRDIGANQVTGGVTGGARRGLMGKAAWRAFASAYEALRDQDGLPLSYDVLMLYGRK